MKFIMFLFFIILSNSWLVPFSLVEPNIFLKTFLSNIISLLVMGFFFGVHVSHAYVTTGFFFLIALAKWQSIDIDTTKNHPREVL